MDGIWYLDNDGSGTWNAGDRANVFGAAGWTSVIGDWNGDNKTEIGIYKDGTGTWTIMETDSGMPVLTNWIISERSDGLRLSENGAKDNYLSNLF